MYLNDSERIGKYFVNDLTKEIDTYYNMYWQEFHNKYHHAYILVDKESIDNHTFKIVPTLRYPNEVTAFVKYKECDGKKIIKSIEINNQCYGFHCSSINDIVTSKRWIGKELILEEELE